MNLTRISLNVNILDRSTAKVVHENQDLRDGAMTRSSIGDPDNPPAKGYRIVASPNGLGEPGRAFVPALAGVQVDFLFEINGPLKIETRSL